MFKKLNVTFVGNVGLKVHTGEIGGKYFLTPDFLQDIYNYTNGTFIECNTAYLSGHRETTERHKHVLQVHGWLDKGRRTIIMDENPDDDFVLNIPNHRNISLNYVGAHMRKIDNVLVLAHFKGHPAGGFGGVLKQLSIGFASRRGKTYIHTGGYTTDYKIMTQHIATQKDFTSAMADAASSIINYFKYTKHGQIVYINVLSNISKWCDCGGARSPPPKIRDLGILASHDPVAIDRAAYDLIKSENNEGSKELIGMSEGLLGTNTLTIAEELGIGTQDYNLIDVDSKGVPISKKNILLLILIPILLVVVIVGIIVGIVLFRKFKKNDSTSSSNSQSKVGIINE